jgi:hypothetical protein
LKPNATVSALIASRAAGASETGESENVDEGMTDGARISTKARSSRGRQSDERADAGTAEKIIPKSAEKDLIIQTEPVPQIRIS